MDFEPEDEEDALTSYDDLEQLLDYAFAQSDAS